MMFKLFHLFRKQQFLISAVLLVAIISGGLSKITTNIEYEKPKYAQASVAQAQTQGKINNPQNENEDYLIKPGELLVTLRNPSDTTALEYLDQEKISKQNPTIQSQTINAINSVLPGAIESSNIDNTFAVKLRDPIFNDNARFQPSIQNLQAIQPIESDGVKLSQSPQTKALKEKLQQNPNVAFVTYNRVYQTNNVNPLNDPLYNEQWHLNNTGQAFPVKSAIYAGGTDGQDIRAESLWAQDISNGADNLVVGVSDSGVDITHPDLEENIWINQGEITAQQKLIFDTNNNGSVNAKEILTYFRDPVRVSGMDFNLDGSIDLLDAISTGSILIDNLDQDSNGFKDDLVGWNFVDNNNNPIDLNGHGTHVAGIIAASSNQIGIRGVAYNAQIMPLRVGTVSGGISSKASIKANLYAETMQPKVINYSWGGVVTVSENDPEVLSFNLFGFNSPPLAAFLSLC